MNPKILPAFVTFGGLALILGGCASEPQSYLVSAPPPQAPTSAPAPGQLVVTQPQQVIVTQPQPQIVTTNAVPVGTNSYIVMQAPPAPPPPAAVPERPTSQHVWLAGYWTWQNNRYEWMAGHWAMPPHSAANWVNPRWAPEGGSYRFHEGYWN